jgi:hypothetical protein
VPESDDDKSELLAFRISKPMHKYLVFLSRNTVLGHKETDVARYLLTERLKEMIRTKEHDKLKPPEDTSG